MRVLFLKHVINVWKPWEIKEVKPGYAMNMLFPQWLAIELTSEAEKKHKEKIKKEESRRMELIENRHIISDKLNWVKLDFKLKGTANKLFWAVAEKDVIWEIKKKFKIELTKQHIDMPDGHLKKVWEHAIYIKLWKDSMAKIFIIINPES